MKKPSSSGAKSRSSRGAISSNGASSNGASSNGASSNGASSNGASRAGVTAEGTPPAEELVSTIEHQIIPRLLRAEAEKLSPEPCPDERLPPSEAEVDALTALALAQDLEGMILFAENKLIEGLSIPSLFLDLIGSASRLLGERWLSDELSFAEVTIGTASLQRLVAVMGRKGERSVTEQGLVLLFPAPGEQHTLSLHLFAELLRLNGWTAHVDTSADETELIDLVANEYVVTCGVTVRETDDLRALRTLLTELRAASQNPDVSFLLGGTPSLEAHAAELGAKYCATIRQAVGEVG